MSLSGAASSVSKPQVLAAVLWLAALACAFLGAAQAVPQGTPTVMVDRFEYSVGDTLTVAASGLEPGAAYVVTLTSPDGQASARTVTASPAGALSARSELGEPGPWTVELSGPRIDARLGVRVVGVGPAPGAGPSAPEGDTEVPGEEPASPGVPPEADAPEPAAAPDTEAPGVDEPADAPAAPDAAEPGDALPEPETEREGAEQLPPARQGQGGIVPSEPAVPPAQARAAIEVSIDGDDVVGRRNGVEAWRTFLTDYDKDGDQDLVCQFLVQDLGLPEGQSIVEFTASTVDGAELCGSGGVDATLVNGVFPGQGR